MSKKIGQTLLERELITPDQLSTALQTQVTRGDRLGVNLLELGMVSERDLGQALGELHRTRYAPPEALNEVDETVLHSLPRELIEKHRAVPFKYEGETLHLVVPALDNLYGLSSATGKRIVPWIAPEVSVARELERHYDIPMAPRTSRIVEQLETTERPAGQGTPIEASPSDEEEIADADFGYGRSWRDIAAGMDDDPESLGEQFCAVTRADDAARLLLDRVAGNLTNCILFRVTDNTATIWDARSGFVDKYARDSVSMSTVSDSLLELLAARPHYGGPVPLEESYRSFFSLTGLPVPREILLIPVYVGRRPVAILYGDGGNDGTVSRHLEEHVELARQFGLALALVVIKKKLMS